MTLLYGSILGSLEIHSITISLLFITGRGLVALKMYFVILSLGLDLDLILSQLDTDLNVIHQLGRRPLEDIEIVYGADTHTFYHRYANTHVLDVKIN